jgi:hypothetical protein
LGVAKGERLGVTRSRHRGARMTRARGPLVSGSGVRAVVGVPRSVSWAGEWAESGVGRKWGLAAC